MGEAGIHRVHNGDQIVQDHVGIIGHAVGNNVLTLKEVNGMIVDTDVTDISSDLHEDTFLFSK